MVPPHTTDPNVSPPNSDTNSGAAVSPAGPHSSGGSGLVVPGQGDGSTWEVVGENTTPSFVFSARTCLELLPMLSSQQIETEIHHLRALDSSVNFRCT